MNYRYPILSCCARACIRSFDFLLFSNLFISVGAVAQGLATYQLIGIRPSAMVLVYFLTSTFISYNLAMLGNRSDYRDLTKSRRQTAYVSSRKLIMALFITCILVSIPIYFQFTLGGKVLLLFLGIPAVFYNLPVIPVAGKNITPRSVIVLKPILIALVWSASTVIIPVWQARFMEHAMVPNKLLYQLLLERFLFFCAMTIPYDIRDMESDKRNGTKTIPVLWGKAKANVLCLFLFLLYLLLLCLFQTPVLQLVALISVLAYATWLIFGCSLAKNEYYFFFLLDGVFIMQYLALIAFEFLK